MRRAQPKALEPSIKKTEVSEYVRTRDSEVSLSIKTAGDYSQCAEKSTSVMHTSVTHMAREVQLR